MSARCNSSSAIKCCPAGATASRRPVIATDGSRWLRLCYRRSFDFRRQGKPAMPTAAHGSGPPSRLPCAGPPLLLCAPPCAPRAAGPLCLAGVRSTGFAGKARDGMRPRAPRVSERRGSRATGWGAVCGLSLLEFSYPFSVVLSLPPAALWTVRSRWPVSPTGRRACLPARVPSPPVHTRLPLSIAVSFWPYFLPALPCSFSTTYSRLTWRTILSES